MTARTLGRARPAGPRAVRAAWSWRLREMLSTWLPILLMGLLALGTWWLVKSTPAPAKPRAAQAPRHEPDYTMERFSVQRFAADGRQRVLLEGVRMQHYPDTDVLEIEDVRVRAVGDDGRLTLASASRAQVNGAATELRLDGGAHVQRPADNGDDSLDIRAESIQAFLDSDRLRAERGVWVRFGTGELRAETVEYDHASRAVVFTGRVRASFLPGARRAPPAP
jgi:lipopolysaccharide export system protein LptC